MPHEQFNALIDSIRSRVQAELDAQLSALAVRHEDALAAARQDVEADAARRMQDAVAAVRREAEAEAERRTLEAVQSARREAETEAERRIAAMTPPPVPSMSPAIIEGISAIDEADSISAMLNAVGTAASSYGALLFVGPELESWPAASAAPSAAPAGLARESFTAGRMLRRDGAVASPLMLDGTAIGVLHASSPGDADGEAIDIIARYAAARLGLLTATRTLQVRRWLATTATGHAVRPSERKTDPDQVTEDDEVQSARRYARLLLSEIKLYNETTVNEGRAHRDLSRRLGAEIERARRLYEERVPSTIDDRARHFHHELIQTLAGGDPTLLG